MTCTSPSIRSSRPQWGSQCLSTGGTGTDGILTGLLPGRSGITIPGGYGTDSMTVGGITIPGTMIPGSDRDITHTALIVLMAPDGIAHGVPGARFIPEAD